MLVIGCNYHTTWQSNKAMRFVLLEVDGDRAKLGTRYGSKPFWTNTSDLIFIESKYNKDKAELPLEDRMKYVKQTFRSKRYTA
jgi:hypothetical protein